MSCFSAINGGEKAKVSIRNIRREANEELKKKQKETSPLGS